MSKEHILYGLVIPAVLCLLVTYVVISLRIRRMRMSTNIREMIEEGESVVAAVNEITEYQEPKRYVWFIQSSSVDGVIVTFLTPPCHELPEIESDNFIRICLGEL